MTSNYPNRYKLAKYTYGFVLIIFVYRYCDYTTTHQLKAPVLFDNDLDYTYWLFHYLQIPELILKNQVRAITFDLLLFVTALYCFLTSAKSTLITLVNAICCTCYALIYNSYSCHHNYTVIGIMILPYAFLAKDPLKFKLVWDLFRYFTLYIFLDAFIFKAFINTNIFYPDIGREIIKMSQGRYILQNPGTITAEIYLFFIKHTKLAYAGFIGMISLQAACLIGFFTKKFDKYLFFIPVLFHLLNYFFVDVMFFELLILNVTLLPIKHISAHDKLK